MIKKDINGMDLLEKLLQLNPSARLNAQQAINHDFFWTNPLPKSLKSKLSTIKTNYNVHETLRKPNVNENGDFKW